MGGSVRRFKRTVEALQSGEKNSNLTFDFFEKNFMGV